MNFKKMPKFIFCLILSAQFTFLLASCDFSNGSQTQTPNDDSTDGSNNDSTSDSTGTITDDNDVTITTPTTTSHNFELVSSNDGTYVYKCSDCDEEISTTISCESGTENAVSVTNETITFSNLASDTVYKISGEFYGNIVIDAGDDYKFELELNGFTLSSSTNCPISILSGDKVTISAKKETINYVYDLREAIDESDENAISASIYSLCDLDIEGKGTLYVSSTNNNGIHTKDDLNIKNLTLQVECEDNALKGNDSVTIESGKITLISRSGDGIKTTNSDVSSKGNQRGIVKITGGEVVIYAACDGIDAAYDVQIDETNASVSLEIFTDKYSKYSEEVTATSESVYYIRSNSSQYNYSIKFFDSEGNYKWENASSLSSDRNSRYYEVSKPSGYTSLQVFIYSSSMTQGQEEEYVACSEVMNVNENYDTIAVQIRGNNFVYSWTNYTTQEQGRPGNGGFPGGGGGMNEGNSDKGDHSTKGIKAGNAINIDSGNVTIKSYDDAIHANNDSTLENGSSPLGNITINGGNLTLYSNDDGIHADNLLSINDGKVNIINSYEGLEGTKVSIAGGDISILSSDDGINGTGTSGSSITISGGTTYVYAKGDGIDSNSTSSYSGITFSGGKTVIISTSGGNSSIDSERGYSYESGYVVALGASGGMSNEATNTQTNLKTTKSISLQKDSYLVVKDLVTVKMPVSLNSSVVVLGKSNANITSSSESSMEFDNNGVSWNL